MSFPVPSAGYKSKSEVHKDGERKERKKKEGKISRDSPNHGCVPGADDITSNYGSSSSPPPSIRNQRSVPPSSLPLLFLNISPLSFTSVVHSFIRSETSRWGQHKHQSYKPDSRGFRRRSTLPHGTKSHPRTRKDAAPSKTSERRVRRL